MIKRAKEDQIATVFDQCLCVSCGVCNVNRRTHFSFDKQGYLLPNDTSVIDIDVCPMISRNTEDDIAARKFSATQKYDETIGYFNSIRAAKIRSKNRIKTRSSGGIITFILEKLLLSKEVDAIATVFPYDEEPYFRYELCDDPERLLFAATSAYYPIEASEVLAEAKRRNVKIAITGLPCAIKGVNNLMEVCPEINDLVQYQISLICGHLKTSKYLDLLSRQLKEVEKPVHNFRERGDRSPAKEKYFGKKNGEKNIIARTSTLYGGTYNYGFFQYNGCNYCDDIIGETADISVGDAWLPEYVERSEGMSLCISRNERISVLLEDDQLVSDKLSPRDVIEAQAGGYRQKREGLKTRLVEFPVVGIRKRMHLLPIKVNARRKAIYRARYFLAKRSIDYYEDAISVDLYIQRMAPALAALKACQADSWLFRLYMKMLRELRKVFKTTKWF